MFKGHDLTIQHNHRVVRGHLGGGRTEGALSQGSVALAGWEAWSLPSGVDPPEEAGWGIEPAPQSPLTSFAPHTMCQGCTELQPRSLGA